MKRILLVTAFVLTTSAANAQGYGEREDRGYDRDRHENSGERIVREMMRGMTGQRDCRYETVRRRDRDGDIVETRRRIYD